MKITIYTINDCVFCQQEKEYLKSKSITFTEKNLEQNRDFLTEMLTISNNFAGTPVTKVEKDDGSIVVLKGFTKEEFDEVLGFNEPQVATIAAPTPQVTEPQVAVAPKPVAAVPVPQAQVVMPAQQPAQAQVQMPEPVKPQPVMPVVVPAPVAPVQAPVAPQMPQQNNQMDALQAQLAQLQKIQQDLMAQAAKMQNPQPAPVAPVQAPVAPQMPQQNVMSQPQAMPQVQAAAPATPATNTDDSLAAILAELQSKMNNGN